MREYVLLRDLRFSKLSCGAGAKGISIAPLRQTPNISAD